VTPGIRQTSGTYQHLSQEVSMGCAEQFVTKRAGASKALGKATLPS